MFKVGFFTVNNYILCRTAIIIAYIVMYVNIYVDFF